MWLRLFLKVGLPLLVILAIGGYIMHLRGDVAKWQGRVHHIADIVQEVGEFKGRSKGDRAGKLGYKDVEPGIRKIGSDRDAARRQVIGLKGALADQTTEILAMSQRTLAARQEADRQRELVRQLTAQRDTWINRARTAATRKERLSADVEAQQMEEALNALRDANF